MDACYKIRTCLIRMAFDTKLEFNEIYFGSFIEFPL